MAENKNPLQGLCGAAYAGRSKRFDNQRCVNLYLEVDEQLGSGSASPGKNKQLAVLLGTPGLRLAQPIGVGPQRGLYEVSNQNLAYVVSGNQVFQLSGANSVPVALNGNLTTLTGPVSISDNGQQVIFVDGQNGYYYTLGDDSLTLHTITDPNFYPADVVTFQDGYFILNYTGTNIFFTSNLYTVTFPALNESQKSGNSDILVSLISLNRNLYLLGSRTIEQWTDTGASGASPFSRNNGWFSQQGCAAAQTLKVVNEDIYWLGTNAQGGGVVYAIVNGQFPPQRVSTFAVENSLQAASDLSGSTAYSYQQDGHFFYVLNVPGLNTTWVFDASSNLWHERQSSVNGVLGRHLGQTHCVLDGVHLVGDYSGPNLYTYDLSCYTDNGQPLPRIRQTPQYAANLNNVFMHLIELDLQFGVGLVDDGTNTTANVSPKVTLEVSRDGGQTWSLPVQATMGKIGQWAARARFQGLGVARSPIFRFTITDAVEVQILSALADFEQGDS